MSLQCKVVRPVCHTLKCRLLYLKKQEKNECLCVEGTGGREEERNGGRGTSYILQYPSKLFNQSVVKTLFEILSCVLTQSLMIT